MTVRKVQSGPTYCLFNSPFVTKHDWLVFSCQEGCCRQMDVAEHGVGLWKLWTTTNGDRGHLRTADRTFRWARDGGWHRPGDTRSLRSGFRTVPTFGGSDLIGSRAGPVDRVVDEWVHQHSGRHESIGTRALPFLMTPTVPTGDH